MDRIIDVKRGTSEYQILADYFNGKDEFNPSVISIEKPKQRSINNPISEEIIGRYRKSEARVSVLSDYLLMKTLIEEVKVIPSFAEAGPRKSLSFNPLSVKAAIVTTGGIAPGLHSVIHAIVQRHHNVYKLNENEGGIIYGIRDGFRGLCRDGSGFIKLTPQITERWLSLGGSQLGSVRYYPETSKTGGDSTISQNILATEVLKRLTSNNIDILYVLGGDGSMRVAHQIAGLSKDKSIACVPKTMDNDILWVWESFGFSTAVEEAARVVNTLHQEAVSTRRICIIELFGAESGFVAANASLASGHADLVLIPEVFRFLASKEGACERYWDACISHIEKKIKSRIDDHDPHALIVVAQGVSTIFDAFNIEIHGHRITKTEDLFNLFHVQLKDIKSTDGDEIKIFENQPKHNIRAVTANAHDQIYCERLGALIVDNALAGYTDFMVSQWMTEYVLVPLSLPTSGQKSIPLDGVFWKQVTNVTGQPSHESAIMEITN